MTLRHLAAAVSVLAVVASAGHPAKADPAPADRVAARTLFDDARALMKSQQYAAACPKLEESQRLDPGIGTLFNLADCYDGLGRLASAWTLFLDVAEASQRAGEPERARVANARADAITPRLPHVRVTTGSDAGLVLTLDHRPFAAPLIDTLVPIDPGEHVIEADAPAKKHWELTFQASAGASFPVLIPPLDDAPAPPIVLPVAPPPVGVAEAAASPSTARPADASRWHVPVAIGVAATGVVGLAIGGVFGLEATSDWSTAKPSCSDGRCTTPSAYSAWQSAHTAGIASTASFIAGGALVGVGAVVWLTRPKTSVRVGIRPDGAMALSGRFP